MIFLKEIVRVVVFSFFGFVLMAGGVRFLKLDGSVVTLGAGEALKISGGQTQNCYAPDRFSCPTSTSPAYCGFIECKEQFIMCDGSETPIYSCPIAENLFSSTNSSYGYAYNTQTATGNRGITTGTENCGTMQTCDDYVPSCSSLKSHCQPDPEMGLYCMDASSQPVNFSTSAPDPTTPACNNNISTWFRAHCPSDPLFATALLNGVWFSVNAQAGSGLLQ